MALLTSTPTKPLASAEGLSRVISAITCNSSSSSFHEPQFLSFNNNSSNISCFSNPSNTNKPEINKHPQGSVSQNQHNTTLNSMTASTEQSTVLSSEGKDIVGNFHIFPFQFSLIHATHTAVRRFKCRSRGSTRSLFVPSVAAISVTHTPSLSAFILVRSILLALLPVIVTDFKHLMIVPLSNSPQSARCASFSPFSTKKTRS